VTHFLYSASVPVFLRYLERLAALVDTAEAHAQAQGMAAAQMLQARLAPDMHPFASQVEIAANFTLRACYPLAGRDVPPYGAPSTSINALRARIAHAAALLRDLQPAHFENSAARQLHSAAGNAVVSLPATEFLFQYALPNFFFHVTAAYAILRSTGVAVGKEDFDGFHSYPPENSN